MYERSQAIKKDIVKDIQKENLYTLSTSFTFLASSGGS